MRVDDGVIVDETEAATNVIEPDGVFVAVSEVDAVLETEADGETVEDGEAPVGSVSVDVCDDDGVFVDVTEAADDPDGEAVTDAVLVDAAVLVPVVDALPVFDLVAVDVVVIDAAAEFEGVPEGVGNIIGARASDLYSVSAQLRERIVTAEVPVSNETI